MIKLCAGALLVSFAASTSPAGAQCGVLGSEPTGILGDVVLSGPVTLNTDTGDILDGGGVVVSGGASGVSLSPQPGGGPWLPPALRTYDFRSLHVAPGAVVTVTGDFGVALLASDSITVDGLLDLSGGDGGSGQTNLPGPGGAGTSGGWDGGQFAPVGCVAGNGQGEGAGAGSEGGCGPNGGAGEDGFDGAGGGGGGGGCGGSGGGGAAHLAAGGAGLSGAAGDSGTVGGQPPGFGGAAGPGCAGGPGDAFPGFPYGDPGLAVLFGGSGGGGGGFGGLGGSGGNGVGTGGTGFGGLAGPAGGPGGGGGGGGAMLLCAGIRVHISTTGGIDVSGGNGGLGGGHGFPGDGQTSLFGSGPIGGGGGAGASGTGGGGGGGSGGAIYIAAAETLVEGTLDVSGGLGGQGGLSFSGGGNGGPGRDGGGVGGGGGASGDGGDGGDGGAGHVVLVETATSAYTLPPLRNRLELERPFPNPMSRGEGRFAFSLPTAGRTDVVIYDVRGRRVRDLIHRELPAGRHTVRWDGRDEAGQEVPGGVYFVSLATAEGRGIRKVTRVN